MSAIRLPDEYHEIRKVDLKGNKKEFIFVNLVALLIIIIMTIIGNTFMPLFDVISTLIRIRYYAFLVLLMALLSIVAYVVSHEAVHGIFIKKYSGEKAKYGFDGAFAFAKSDYYFNKKEYIIIALSPIIIWGVLLTIINVIVPYDWFWFVYFIQMTNISGAAGDLYVSLLVRKLPADVMIHDIGVSMTIYSKQSI